MSVTEKLQTEKKNKCEKAGEEALFGVYSHVETMIKIVLIGRNVFELICERSAK